MRVTNSEFAKRMELLARPSSKFKPTAVYDPDGDCIEFLARPDMFYGERIDDLVTVYLSHDTDEVVGSLIKGVSRFCREMLQKMPGFSIEIQDGDVCLQHIFLAKLWHSAPSEDIPSLPTLTYRKLIDLSRETVVHGEICLQ